MPPRYAYWTIIIDNAPTAFRARDKEDLIPTLRQLTRANPGAAIKWFARGRLWESPEEARAATERARMAAVKRDKDWRPGGRHEDPRARYRKPRTGPRPAGRPLRRDRTAGERHHDAGRASDGRSDRDVPVIPEPPPPPPPQPPGPGRPPRPGHEPGPQVPQEEPIRIIPEPPERASRKA